VLLLLALELSELLELLDALELEEVVLPIMHSVKTAQSVHTQPSLTMLHAPSFVQFAGSRQ